jgi:hypothetical protein
MPRSRIEIYWKTPETAPDGVIAQVRVTDDSGSDYLLPYPCELTAEGWVNAASSIGCPRHLLEALRRDASEDKTREGDLRADKGRVFPTELFSSRPQKIKLALNVFDAPTIPPAQQ